MPLENFLMTPTLKSKVSNWGNETAVMSHVKFEHIKGTPNILAGHISRLKVMELHDLLSSEEHGQEFGEILKPLPPIQVNEVKMQRLKYLSN